MPSELEQIKSTLSKVGQFMEEKYNPLEQNVTLMGEEMEKVQTEVRSILENQKRLNLNALRSRGNDDPKVPSGKYRGKDDFDLKISEALLRHVKDEMKNGPSGDFSLTPSQIENWENNLQGARRALDDTTPGAGDELLYTGESSEMWRDVHLMTSVGSLFDKMMMPTNPFQYPFDFGDINWFRGAANIAGSSTNPLTGRRTLTATELVGAVSFSYNLDEDSVVAVMPRTAIPDCQECIRGNRRHHRKR